MANGRPNNRISFGQYKVFDLLLFLIIMVVCEIINVLAIKKWFTDQMFSISVMLLITLIVLVRWNGFGVIYPIVDGVLYCWLMGATWQQYIIYIVGNACVALVALLFLAVPKEKMFRSWFFTVLFACLGYVVLIFSRAAVAACFGTSYISALGVHASSELFNLIFAVVGLLIVRRLPSMLEDQKAYVKKVTYERDNPRRPDEYHWEGYTELDPEELKKFAEMNDYDRAINYNNKAQFDEPESAEDENDLSRLDS